jgi:hypothetical protein
VYDRIWGKLKAVAQEGIDAYTKAIASLKQAQLQLSTSVPWIRKQGEDTLVNLVKSL